MIDTKNISGQTFNIGSEYNISIDKLASIISNLMKVKIQIMKDKKRLRPTNSEVDILSCSSKKAKKILNWKPEFNNEKGLKKGLIKTIEWFENKNNLKNYKSNIYNI